MQKLRETLLHPGGSRQRAELYEKKSFRQGYSETSFLLRGLRDVASDASSFQWKPSQKEEAEADFQIIFFSAGMEKIFTL